VRDTHHQNGILVYLDQVGDDLCSRALVKNDRFALEILREIRTMRAVVEMLKWKKVHEHEIRGGAAEIISNMVKIDRNSIPGMAIPTP
jgi:hypothetical protein